MQLTFCEQMEMRSIPESITEVHEEEANGPHDAETHHDPIRDVEHLSQKDSSVEQKNTDLGETLSNGPRPLYCPKCLVTRSTQFQS